MVDMVERLRRACGYENVDAVVRTFNSRASNGLVLDAADEMAALRDTLRVFREFVLNNATQWKLGANHHHPIWARVSEALGDDNGKQPTEAEWREFIYTEAPFTAGER